MKAGITAASAAGGKGAEQLRTRIAEAEAAVAAAGADPAAIDQAQRAIDVVQMIVEDAIAAKPVPKYVPSPEAIRFTRHFKQVMAEVAALSTPEAARLKKDAIDVGKLGQHSRRRAEATAGLSRSRGSSPIPRHPLAAGGTRAVQAASARSSSTR